MSVEETLSQSSARSPRLTRSQRRAVLAASLGNVVEYYDWTVYATFVAIFSPHFFPSGDAIGSLLSALAVFAVGFVARPIGAMALGAYADRRGRKKALVVSIIITSAGALTIAVLPDYRTVGVLAPVLLVVARLAQGFSAGGEGSGSMTFLAESAPARRRGLVGSFQQVSTGVGILLASLTGTLLTSTLSSAALSAWGWRVAFVVAAFLGLIVLYLRTSVDETEAFRQRTGTAGQGEPKAAPAAKDSGVLAAFRRHPKEMAQIFFLGIPATIVNYLWLSYFPNLAHTLTGIPLKDALLANTIALVFSCAVLPFCGIFSDRFGRKANLYIFTIGFVVFSYPALQWMSNSFLAILLIQLVGVLLLAFDGAIVASTYNELFPVGTRASGSALPFALSVALFGGTAPFIVTWMFSSGYGAYIWLYPAVGALVGLLATFRLPETRDRAL